jgi:hypothetical protein
MDTNNIFLMQHKAYPTSITKLSYNLEWCISNQLYFLKWNIKLTNISMLNGGAVSLTGLE